MFLPVMVNLFNHVVETKHKIMIFKILNREFCESRKTLPPSVGRGAILNANELGISP